MKASKNERRQKRAVFLLTNSLRKQSTESLELIRNICINILVERELKENEKST